jgi:hypothetical protein
MSGALVILASAICALGACLTGGDRNNIMIFLTLIYAGLGWILLTFGLATDGRIATQSREAQRIERDS